jgi:hypothetical protein
VDESAQDCRWSQARHARIVDWNRRNTQGLWSLLIQSAVGTMTVVVRDVFGQDLFEMAASENEHPVEALSAHGTHEPFGERIRSRGPHRCLDDADALGAEHLVEAVGELRVSVPDEKPGCSAAFGQDERQVASLLGDPLPHRVGSDAREVDPPSVDLDEEQHVETAEKHRVDGEKVAGQHGCRLGLQELRPGRTRSPGCRLDSVLTQDGPHGRRRQPDSGGSQLSVNPPVSPRGVLPG